MRRLIPKLLFAFFVFTFIAIGCKKNDRLTIPETPELPQSDAGFLNARLKSFIKEIAPVLSNKEARARIRQMASNKFDGEYEVLIKDIFSDPVIASMSSQAPSNQLHLDIFARAGEYYYPQIYIPRMQHEEENTTQTYAVVPGFDSVSIDEDPIMIFYTGDAEVDEGSPDDVYPGYKLENGELVFVSNIDEEYANENEVWVVSINEAVNEMGRMPIPCELDPCAPGCPPVTDETPCGGGGGGGGGTGGGGTGGGPDDDPTDAPTARVDFPEFNHNKINFKIENMRVADPKESWVAGAAEVSIRAKLVCHNGRREGIPGAEKMEYSSDQYSNYLGKLIQKVKRKKIKNVDLLTVNYSMQTNWQNEVPSIDPVHFIYVIFERDTWPAKLNQDVRYSLDSPISFEPNPGPFNLYYRSAEKNYADWHWPYARYYFTNTLWLASATTYAGSGYVTNEDITFNTVLY